MVPTRRERDVLSLLGEARTDRVAHRRSNPPRDMRPHVCVLRACSEAWIELAVHARARELRRVRESRRARGVGAHVRITESQREREREPALVRLWVVTVPCGMP